MILHVLDGSFSNCSILYMWQRVFSYNVTSKGQSMGGPGGGLERGRGCYYKKHGEREII